jgi:hypothetical protein
MFWIRRMSTALPMASTTLFVDGYLSLKKRIKCVGEIVNGRLPTHVRSNGQTYAVQVELVMRQLLHPPPLSGSLN